MTDLVGLDPAPEATPPDAEASTYRPHIDGVRAVAVYLVVLFHAGLGSFRGGFIGVDVFFVLSGYLVTGLILRGLRATGRVGFARFYSRRLRRLFPASALALIGTAIVYSAVAGPGEAATARGGFQAAFLYVSNWYFIHQSTGYFGASVGENPVLHFWSLAVEEQFYVAWPLIIGGLWALARRFRVRAEALLTGLVAAGIVGSAWLALHFSPGRPDRAYFGTDARAYQLLAGAALALAPGAFAWMRARTRLADGAAIVGLAGIVVLGTSAIDMGPIERGLATTLATVVLLLGVEGGAVGPVRRALGRDTIAYLGRISYGVYLWHWPVIVVATLVAQPEPVSLALLSIVLATGLAAASYELIEHPIRASARLDRHRPAVIATGIGMGVLAAVAVIPWILPDSPATPIPVTQAKTSTPAVTGPAFTPVPKSLDLDAVAAAGEGTEMDCRDKPATACTVVRGPGRHILLMGDSTAQMLGPAFTSLAKAQGLRLSIAAIPACTWQRGFYGVSEKFPTAKDKCRSRREDVYDRLIPALKPDIIVLVNLEEPRDARMAAQFRAATRSSLRQLEAPGRQLVLIEPVIHAPLSYRPLRCLADATYLEDCRFIGERSPDKDAPFYRSLARRDPALRVVNLDRLACPYLPICDPVISGQVVHWDALHLATGYSATLGPKLGQALELNGVALR